jgi:hypothetical protein
MNIRRLIIVCLAPAALAWAASSADGQRWWSHVRFLADDALEGRDTGSPGYRKAADYVESKLREAGVEPAGSSGYEQTVRFHSRRILEEKSSLMLVREGKSEPLIFGEEAVVSLRAEPAPALEAPVAFVGYGVSVPEKGYDDLAGIDLHGKLAMYLAGSPQELSSELSAHAQSSGERWKALRAAGAVGEISVSNPRHMESPWERRARARLKPSMSLSDPSLNELEGDKLSLAINPAHAERIFAGSGHTFAEIVDLAEARKPLPHFAVPGSLRASIAEESGDVESFNVLGILRGTDRMLSKEYVVLSAHLDHLGIGAPVNGDAIYNGAMDNASGCAALLDFAETLRDSRTRLRRSVLLAFVTGEEKGLLGSRYFATHPTVPRDAMVADLNIDMFLPLFPLRLVTVLGLDESDLGDEVRAAAKPLGIAVQRDQQPERHIFIRSDQYNFVRQGVPAIMVDVAAPSGTREADTLKRWLSERYHAPSDDAGQPVDLAAAAAYERLMFTVAEAIANRDERPRWKETSFFRRFASR